MENDSDNETDSLLERQHSSDSLLEHPLANLDVDRVLVEKLGEFGRYQKFVYILVCLPAALTAGITLGSVFTEYVPDHRCFIRGCDDEAIPRYDDAFYLNFYNFTIPSNLSSCNQYKRINDKNTCTAKDFTKQTLSTCDGYLFDDSVMKNSLVSEFDLVCDQVKSANYF